MKKTISLWGGVRVDIERWLRELGLERYTRTFLANDVDVQILKDLTVEDLRDLGIDSVGHRRKLLAAIAALDDLPADSAPREPAPAAEPATATRLTEAAERRQLTVLFCDMVGSTALSTHLDPEDLRAVIARYQACCDAVIDRFEGVVARFIGDGVLAYFGYPRAHEDDAERAVRAGLALVDAIGELRPHGDVALQARIGIATGLVVVGEMVSDRGNQEHTVIGETPNLAARLQTIAATDTVVIGTSTRQLLGGLFEYADLGSHELKGFAQPVEAWQVVAPSAAESRFEARHMGTMGAQIGREEEINFLLGRWHTASGGEGQVVPLSGEPGIGKSHLVQTLRARLAEAPHTRLRYYCSPYHVNSALHPVIDQMERAAGLQRTDAVATKLDKLEAVLAATDQSLDDVVPLIAAMLSIPTGDRYPPTNLTPQTGRTKIFEALAAQLRALAHHQPVLMILEDAHWIDPSSLALFNLVVDEIQRLPVLLVVTSRPTFEPPWTGYPHVTALTLNRLNQRHGAAMVAQVAGGKELPAEVVNQILAKTDGVPLFVEELTKTVIDAGLLTDAGDHYVLSGPTGTGELAIPATLQDSLMARLDRLAPVKEVAQIAAAIGREFLHALLASVSPMAETELEEAIQQLCTAELILRRGTPPQASYSFKHALVQNAAYDSLLRTTRQQLHLRIALALEAEFPQTASITPEVLMHHFQRAGALDRALPHAFAAGDAAVAQYASVEARSRYQSALEMATALPPSDQARRDQVEATLKLAGVASNRTEFAADLERLERALTVATDLGDRSLQARCEYWRGRLNYVLGKFDQTVAHARHALEIAEAIGAGDDLTAAPINLLARVHCLRGEAREASDFAALSLKQMHALGDRIEEAAIAGVLAFALGLRGRFKEAFTAADRGIALARDLDHAPTLAACLHFRGVVDGWAGDISSSVANFDQALALCAKSGDLFRTYLIHGWRGEAYVIAGNAAAAEDDLTRCLALADQIGTSFHRAAFQAFQAHACLLKGDVERALEITAAALAVASGAAEAWSHSIALRVRAEALLRADPPDPAAAADAIRRAIEVQDARDCRCDLAWSRLVQADVAEAKGDRRGATAAFAAAAAMFEQIGLVRGLTLAEAGQARCADAAGDGARARNRPPGPATSPLG